MVRQSVVQAEAYTEELLKIALKQGLLRKGLIKARQAFVTTAPERAAQAAKRATREVQSTAKDIAKARSTLPVATGKVGPSPELQLQLMKMKRARGLA